MSSRKSSESFSRKKSKSNSLNTVLEKDTLFSSHRSNNKSKNKIYSKQTNKQHTRQESELKMIQRLPNVPVKSVDKFRMMVDQHVILQPQKKVEIFDSHAIDFSKLQRLNSEHSSNESFLLPLKTKGKFGIERKNPEGESFVNSFMEHTMQTDGVFVASDKNLRCTEPVNASKGEFSRQTSVGSTLVYTDSTNNDTLSWYMKYRRQKQLKEDLLKKIQRQAHSQRICDKKRFLSVGRVSHLDKTGNTASTKSKGIFPSIFKTELALVDEEKSNVGKEKNRESLSESQKLPNLPGKHSVLNVWRDPRFQNLLSSLVPREERNVRNSSVRGRRSKTI